MLERDEGCIESDAGVSFILSFVVTLFQSEYCILCYSSSLTLLLSGFNDNPHETYSIKTVLPLQVPLMAYGDR